MKRIALITDGWKRLITFAWALGVREYLEDTGLSAAVFHYNTYGNWSRDELNNRGEYNLFSLPELSTFDGILFDGTNITDPAQLSRVIELLRVSGTPVVSIGLDIEGFYYVGIDNERPIRELMAHLHDVHGCRRFLFAGSYQGNFENEHRVKAYREALAEFGLSDEENPVLYGDFDFHTGQRFMCELLAKHQTLPDAVVCSNDNIACGLASEAESQGYQIPRDFRVTGFDNLDKAAFFKPQITTVDIRREKIAYHAMEIFAELWEKGESERYHFVPAHVVYGESCGCENSGAVDYRSYLRDQIVYQVKRGIEDESLDELKAKISVKTRFRDIFRETARFFDSLHVGGFYVVADRRLAEAEAETIFSREGYDRAYLYPAVAMESHRFLTFETLGELESHLNQTSEGSYFLYVPFHFKEQTIGYMLLRDPWFLRENPYLYDILNEVSLTAANLFHGRQLENTANHLRDIYNRDQLTGLYNRIAYSGICLPAYERFREKNVVCAVLFVDADHFKEVNDTYGHEFGDQILKKIASALSRHCPKDGYACRYGGDEFLVFFPNATEGSANEFRQSVETDLAAENVRVSIGITLTDPSENADLAHYVTLADDAMYRVKEGRRK